MPLDERQDDKKFDYLSELGFCKLCRTVADDVFINSTEESDDSELE